MTLKNMKFMKYPFDAILFALLFFIYYNIDSDIQAQVTGKFTDPRDKKTYGWVKIGNQVWMSENLNYSIPGGSWNFKDDPQAAAFFGKLYDWKAAQKACPKGWHLPADSEWTVLIDSLGGENIAGGKLKETGFDYWLSPNKEATNSSGFSGIGSGYRYNEKSYKDLLRMGMYWTATEINTEDAFYRCLTNSSPAIFRYSGEKFIGMSVRCVRNN